MKLIANAMGFYRGKRIRPGAEFEFDADEQVQGRDKKTGKPMVDAKGEPVMLKVQMPKWARPAGSKAEAKPAKPLGDTKPADAAKAAKAKAGGINDQG
jgi:hypothetical protein